MFRLKQILTSLTLLALLTCWPARASEAFQPIQDPDAFAAEMQTLISAGSFKEMSERVAESFGEADKGPVLEQSFAIVASKTFDFSAKVLDRDFNGALRQIIYCAFVADADFIYFRYNFKMTSKGWMLTNFSWKNETQELFPKDFVAEGP